MHDRLASGDKRFTKVDDLTVALNDNIINILTIGDANKLAGVCAEIKKKHAVGIHHAVDIYSHATWLEISHQQANKRAALQKLKDLLAAGRVTCFGDHLNDIPMFEAADAKFAVANAEDALKEKATGIIDSNDNDGVAKYLHAHSGLV